MNKHPLSRRLLALALTLALVVGALAGTMPAHPSIPPLPANCDHWYQDGGTGCLASSGCNWVSPNRGIIWTTHWYCCYDGSGNLTGYDGPWCDWAYNGGCCNNLDSSDHCPGSQVAACPIIR
jgi:hypothetical protein